MKWSRVQQTSARCSAAWVRKQDENWRVKSESVHVEITSAHTLSHKAEAVLSFRRLWFRLSSLTLGTDPWTGQLSAVGPRRALWDAENIPLYARGHSTHPGVSIWDTGEHGLQAQHLSRWHSLSSPFLQLLSSPEHTSTQLLFCSPLSRTHFCSGLLA